MVDFNVMWDTSYLGILTASLDGKAIGTVEMKPHTCPFFFHPISHDSNLYHFQVG